MAPTQAGSIDVSPQTATPAALPRGPQFLGHPVGLFVLFFTEMWERFSYYGMRALLVLYMTNHFLWVQEDASRVYKWYTSLVYFTPLLGGYLADRYLGNRRAVIIGASLMAIGHFLMAFEQYSIFFTALVVLVLGNGFFKPNMATQVGKMYAKNDTRRDGAYTIFYMGVNLGAFLAPLVVGTLGEKINPHWGFGAAGVGMVLGLVTYLIGQRWIYEIPAHDAPAGNTQTPTLASAPVTVSNAERSVYPGFSALAPILWGLLAVVMFLYGIWTVLTKTGSTRDTGILALLGCAALGIIAFVLKSVHGRYRDRTMVIGLIMLFVVSFWFAFEQAGNTLTVWADKHTDRFVFHTGESPAPSVELPAAVEPVTPAATSTGLWGAVTGFEMTASFFQSVNPFFIVTLGPIFAVLWVFLGRRSREPATPVKLSIGVFLAGMSFIPMVMAGSAAHRPSQTRLENLPDTMAIKDGALSAIRENAGTESKAGSEHERALEPYLAGVLTFDSSTKSLHMQGVLPDTERDRVIGDSAPDWYHQRVRELVKKTEAAAERDSKTIEEQVTLDSLPPGFDLRWSNIKDGVRFDEAERAIVATRKLNDRDEKRLLLAAADNDFRRAMFEIYSQTYAFRVSAWWLVLSYFLATAGELCLSPVGLSMVSKLAPAKFATLLMGLWYLNNFFANFLAGFMGELWGKIPPVTFFGVFVGITGMLGVVLLLVNKPLRRLMHGVH